MSKASHNKSGMTLLSAILALKNSRIHVGSTDYSNMVPDVEISVD